MIHIVEPRIFELVHGLLNKCPYWRTVSARHLAESSSENLRRAAVRCPFISKFRLFPSKLTGSMRTLSTTTKCFYSISPVKDENPQTCDRRFADISSIPSHHAIVEDSHNKDVNMGTFKKIKRPKKIVSDSDSFKKITIQPNLSTHGHKDMAILHIKTRKNCQHNNASASRHYPDNIIEVSSASSTNYAFDYESAFRKKIEKKIHDSSYRVFNTINRIRDQFPFARCDNDKFINSEETIIRCSRPQGEVTVWCGNDYLGMSRHSSVISVVNDTMRRCGVGSGGTRNIAGNSVYHSNLESELASLHRKDSALLFSSCYVANDATLSTLGQMLPGCVFFSDEKNHASMIQGIRHSNCRKHIFKHNSVQDLERLLMAEDPCVPKIVAFESVYSMSGSIAPLEAICDVARKYGALTFLDEVHAVGLYGDDGAGVAAMRGIEHKIDILTGTLGKAYGVVGGYVTGSNRMVDTIRSYAPGFIFTTSLPPMMAAGALASVRYLRSQEGKDLRKSHKESVNRMKILLCTKGIPHLDLHSHIIPVFVGDAKKCSAISQRLLNKYGIYVQSINYPTVKAGDEVLRVTPTPWHTPELADYFLNALSECWKHAELPFGCGLHSMCTEERGRKIIP
eukprot:UC4_evm7s1151